MHLNHCLLFAAGLYITFAFDDLSFQAVASQSPIFPSERYNLYEANNALDRNTATCMRTNDIGINSPHETVWWKVDLGGVYSIYSINILFKNYPGYEIRQKGRFAGFSLYVSSTDVTTAADIKGSTLCYKDGPQLPPLNLTRICTESGRYVIFYNERLYEVKYPNLYEVVNVFTELCEVTVQGCNDTSIYGSNCDNPCPTNCKLTCHIQNGTCFRCKHGWTGVYCNTKCGDGWYGNNCSQQCLGHCRDDATCNHVTGQCDKGCAVGWAELQCNEECPSGHFGLDCREHCRGYCRNNEPCDHVSGICPSGCQHGYIGAHCNNECIFFFGVNCKQPCNINCINQTCDRIDGSCLYGCKEGERCDKDIENYPNSFSSSDNLPITVGSLVCACVLIIIGAGIIINVIRLKSSGTMCNTGVLKLCLRSTPAAEESVGREDLSNYQELNFSLQENHYQCISR